MAQSVVDKRSASGGNYSLNDLTTTMKDLTQVLCGSQVEAAKWFEVAYYSVSNFPDVAVKVRHRAHEARTSHEISVNLMKKFSSTSRQMVETVFPLIMEVAKLGNEKNVKKQFDLVIKWSRDMENEAKATRKRYVDLQEQLQTNIEDVRKKHGSVKQERDEVKKERDQEESLMEKDEEDEKKLLSQEEQTEKELGDLKRRQEAIMKEMDEGRKAGMECLEKALSTKFVEGVKAGFKFVLYHVNFSKTVEALKAAEGSIKETKEEHRKMVQERQRQREKVAQRYLTIQRLFLRDELLGDESSLLEAVSHLGQADKTLSKMARFWANVATLLDQLKIQSDVGEAYLDDLSDPAILEIFGRIMDAASSNWEIFSNICGTYVTHSETDPKTSITSIYGFLDGRVDKMTREQRMAKIEELQKDLMSEISNLAITEG